MMLFMYMELSARANAQTKRHTGIYCNSRVRTEYCTRTIESRAQVRYILRTLLLLSIIFGFAGVLPGCFGS